MEVFKRIPRSGAKIRIRDALCGLHTARHPNGKIVEERMDCLLSGLSSRKSQTGFAVPNVQQGFGGGALQLWPGLTREQNFLFESQEKGETGAGHPNTTGDGV